MLSAGFLTVAMLGFATREMSMPPKSKEFHRIAREVLAPVLAEQGFSRPRTVGTWWVGAA